MTLIEIAPHQYAVQVRTVEEELRGLFGLEDRGLNWEAYCWSCGQSWLIRKEPFQTNNVDFLLHHSNGCHSRMRVMKGEG